MKTHYTLGLLPQAQEEIEAQYQQALEAAEKQYNEAVQANSEQQAVQEAAEQWRETVKKSVETWVQANKEAAKKEIMQMQQQCTVLGQLQVALGGEIGESLQRLQQAEGELLGSLANTQVELANVQVELEMVGELLHAGGLVPSCVLC